MTTLSYLDRIFSMPTADLIDAAKGLPYESGAVVTVHRYATRRAVTIEADKRVAMAKLYANWKRQTGEKEEIDG
jgi:hypothetical protein